MATLADALGSESAGRPVQILGKEYRVRKITQGQKESLCAEFMDRVEDRVEKRAKKYRDKVHSLRLEAVALQRKLESMPGDDHVGYMETHTRIREIGHEIGTSEKAAADVVKEFDMDAAACQFEFEGDAMTAFIETGPGVVRLLFALLKDQGVTEADIVQCRTQRPDEFSRLQKRAAWAIGWATDDDAKNGQLPPVPETTIPTA